MAAIDRLLNAVENVVDVVPNCLDAATIKRESATKMLDELRLAFYEMNRERNTKAIEENKAASKATIGDSGPAYPQNDATVNRINNHDGMSLRDHFASEADPRQVYGEQGLSEYIAAAILLRTVPDADDDFAGNIQFWLEATAKWKYMMADAMLKARQQ
jgi:hypothetical protein